MQLKKVILIFLLVISLIFSHLLFGYYFFSESKTSKTEPVSEKTNFSVPKSEFNFAKPLEYSTSPKDISICNKIQKTIEESEFRNARWGLIAISLKDGRAICGIEAQKLFNPASIQKLLTSIVAIDKLGADFRWKTTLFSDGEIENQTLNGDLVLYGRGAPDYSDESIVKLIKDLKKKGVNKVRGNLVADESYFKGDKLGDGWTWNEIQWYYGAEASALTLNENKITVSLQDGKPKADNDLVELNGEVKPIKDIEAIGLNRELGTNKIYVWGNGISLKARVAVNKPVLFAANVFKAALIKNGIILEGEVKTRDWKSSEKTDIAKYKEIAQVESQPLSSIIKKMNKDSINLYAELILRTLGKKFGNKAKDDNPKRQKLRGDDSAGASYMKKWLIEKGIASSEIAIHDGSGLSRLDFVSPEVFTRALIYASNNKNFDFFKNSLPISGQNGTLKGRLKNISGKVLAKTGTITYATSLAGYSKTPTETLAFTIICNNSTNKNHSSKLIDKLVTILTQQT